MNRRVVDALFKRMAIGLSYASGLVKEVANELGIAPAGSTKRRQKDSLPIRPAEGRTDEQREIKRLQKGLKETRLEHQVVVGVAFVSSGSAWITQLHIFLLRFNGLLRGYLGIFTAGKDQNEKQEVFVGVF